MLEFFSTCCLSKLALPCLNSNFQFSSMAVLIGFDYHSFVLQCFSFCFSVLMLLFCRQLQQHFLVFELRQWSFLLLEKLLIFLLTEKLVGNVGFLLYSVVSVFSNVKSAYITLAAACCSGILHCKKQFFEKTIISVFNNRVCV